MSPYFAPYFVATWQVSRLHMILIILLSLCGFVSAVPSVAADAEITGTSPATDLFDGRHQMVLVINEENEGNPLRNATFLLIVVLALCACTAMAPNVRADAESFAKKHIDGGVNVEVLDFGVGEGDPDNRLYVVELLLGSQKELRVAEGPFAGLTLGPTVAQRRRLEMLYQFEDDAWRLESVTVSPGDEGDAPSKDQ